MAAKRSLTRTHSHAPASTVSCKTPRRGRPGDRARGRRGEGGVWTGGAAVSRPGPPAASPGLARAPAAPGPTSSLRRAPQPPRSCAPKGGRVRRAERGSGSPDEPSTLLPGRAALARRATHLRGGRRTPSGPQRLAAGPDALPAAWVPPSREGLEAAGSPATPAESRGEELSGARVARRELRVATGTRLQRTGQVAAAPLQL